VYAASEPLIAGPIGLVLKWRTRRPLLVHLLGELLDLPVSDLHPCRAWAVKTISRFVCKKADRVRCVSRSIVESARKVGIPDKCLIYLPMRVDMSVFSRDRQQAAGLAIRQRFGLDNLPVILFLGTFSVHKGLTYLLRAMAQVSRGYPEARLLLVGSGPLEDELKALVNDLGLVQKVIFAGRITYDQVPAFLAASDLLVLPSLNEGLPRVVLEAMAMGLPVVASRVGGIPELVRDGETGLLVPPRNEEALGKALVSLLADPASRRAMGNHARQHVQSEYEFNINILQYASCIIKMAVC
jgi:glycosyltransferase involved in cell wall biosynthesis